jgi:hypothetical protein
MKTSVKIEMAKSEVTRIEAIIAWNKSLGFSQVTDTMNLLKAQDYLEWLETLD